MVEGSCPFDRSTFLRTKWSDDRVFGSTLDAGILSRGAQTSSLTTSPKARRSSLRSSAICTPRTYPRPATQSSASSADWRVAGVAYCGIRPHRCSAQLERTLWAMRDDVKTQTAHPSIESMQTQDCRGTNIDSGSLSLASGHSQGI